LRRHEAMTTCSGRSTWGGSWAYIRRR
jgi:hypothetical protein